MDPLATKNTTFVQNSLTIFGKIVNLKYQSQPLLGSVHYRTQNWLSCQNKNGNKNSIVLFILNAQQ